jgi:predicted HD phosphohydrolase
VTSSLADPVSAAATSPQRASFHAMTESTAQDWKIIADHSAEFGARLPARVLTHLRLLGGDYGGFAVDRLTHSLQTATRAERAGRPADYVLCALLHDIGDTLGPYGHSEVAAAILEPYVHPDLRWMVEKHGQFQGYYFFHYLGLDRQVRDQYAGHPLFDMTAEFCAEFDQVSFDPEYATAPLEHFEPLVRDLMSAPRQSLYRDSSA